MFVVGGFFGGGVEVGNVGVGKGFGDGEVDFFFVREVFFFDFGFEGGVFVVVVENVGEINDYIGYVVVLEVVVGSVDSFLGVDYVVEVVKFFVVDGIIEEVDIVEVFVGIYFYVEDISFGYVVDKFLGDDFVGVFFFESFGGDVFVGEDVYGFLEFVVVVFEVRGFELGGELEGFGIWDGGKIVSLGGDDGLFFVFDGVDGKVRVFLENFVFVKVVESGSGIGIGNLMEDSFIIGVGI